MNRFPTLDESHEMERIVVVEDDRELRVFLVEVLEEAGYATEAFGTADKALESLLGGLDADLVLTDLIMPGMRGEELLKHLRADRPELDVIVITAFGSVDSAIRLVKGGAHDYLPKPFSRDELLLRVNRALSESRLRREVARLTREPGVTLPGFIAASRVMQRVFDIVRKSANSSHSVLVTGESGTGKELVARALHALSGRRKFVAVNCGALPETLLESELFGHEKGAFTGADRMKEGLFEAAHRGTLFLDELSELPTSLQPKLLRALDDGEVRRVGSTEARTVDVRVVAASNKDLEAEVARGGFREDLYWRVNVLHIELPPLRERPADIPLLAEHFLEQASRTARKGSMGITREAMAAMTHYAWPGNVRELRHAIERAVVLAARNEIGIEDLPPRIRDGGELATRVRKAAEGKSTLDELEHAYIVEVLATVGGNKSRAAEILGIDRKTLYRKLDGHEDTSP
jgi:DNA-binding NtrC family response regulator